MFLHDMCKKKLEYRLGNVYENYILFLYKAFIKNLSRISANLDDSIVILIKK